MQLQYVVNFQHRPMYHQHHSHHHCHFTPLLFIIQIPFVFLKPSNSFTQRQQEFLCGAAVYALPETLLHVLHIKDQLLHHIFHE